MPRKPRFNLPTTTDAFADVQTGGNVVGTMERRTESSSEQSQKVSDNPLSTRTGTKKALSKVTQFRPPHSEARPAKSARVVVPRVLAPRECSTHCADLDDTSSEDEEYIPEADVEESSEESLGNLSEREEVGKSGKETCRKQRDVWHVRVIENGVKRKENITAKEVFSLPAGRKVVLIFDDMNKPVGQAGGLLGTVLGSMASDFSLFPIGTRSWKHMTENKEREYNRQILRFFDFQDDAKGTKKSVILGMLGKMWRDTRGNLFNKLYDDTKSIDDNVKHCCPEEIDQNDWKAFIEYRLEEDTLVRKHGRHASRGEMWTMVHRRNDGSYIHDDARSIGEVIADIESRDESTKELSPNDSLAQVLGKEHSGRVRGVGPGPCLTKLAGSSLQQSSYGVQIEEYQKQIVELRAETTKEKKKTLARQNVMKFLVERLGGDLPPEIASQITALGSGPSTSQSGPSSDNANILSSP
ncbi:hypothetical protein PIB30_007448 [Stylosanthes scabra]|uniref:Uncharacterized protein n=1 Tax=Stylosanthes scabra TaxID=79078 RepID=A0ABU6R474_9FABA|nr:hypothetical protein [Stylosanthes scabra]